MQKKIRIAINGFGRIGRLTARNLISNYSDKIEIVAVNDLSSPENLAYLFKHDSTYHKFDQSVKSTENGILIGGDKLIRVCGEKDPALLPWKEMEIDTVLECTGRFLTVELANLHILAGAKSVIISAPAKDKEILTVVQGVNVPTLYNYETIGSQFPDFENLKKASIISNASCTTNCMAPVLKVLHDNFGIETLHGITTHAYTATQVLQDGPSHKAPRDGRAAMVNMIPSSTGAAKAVEIVIPELKGKLNLSCLRVPTITGSMVYMTINFKKPVTVELINSVLKKASLGDMENIMNFSTEELVSTDIIKESVSTTIDSLLTEVAPNNDKFVKIVIWYDNEWGYANRLAELCILKNIIC